MKNYKYIKLFNNNGKFEVRCNEELEPNNSLSPIIISRWKQNTKIVEFASDSEYNNLLSHLS